MILELSDYIYQHGDSWTIKLKKKMRLTPLLHFNKEGNGIVDTEEIGVVTFWFDERESMPILVTKIMDDSFVLDFIKDCAEEQQKVNKIIGSPVFPCIYDVVKISGRPVIFQEAIDTPNYEMELSRAVSGPEGNIALLRGIIKRHFKEMGFLFSCLKGINASQGSCRWGDWAYRVGKDFQKNYGLNLKFISQECLEKLRASISSLRLQSNYVLSDHYCGNYFQGPRIVDQIDNLFHYRIENEPGAVDVFLFVIAYFRTSPINTIYRDWPYLIATSIQNSANLNETALSLRQMFIEAGINLDEPKKMWALFTVSFFARAIDELKFHQNNIFMLPYLRADIKCLARRIIEIQDLIDNNEILNDLPIDDSEKSFNPPSLNKCDDINNFWQPPLLMEEDCHHFNIIFYQDKYYALAQDLGTIDFRRITSNMWEHHVQNNKCFIAESFEQAKEFVDKLQHDKSRLHSEDLTLYKELAGLRSELEKTQKESAADTVEAVKELIDETDRTLYFPVILETCQEYNIVKYRGKIYGVPQSLGKVDFAQKSQRSLPGILSADIQQELISLIEQKESKEDEQSVQIDNICLLEKYERYNIVSFRSGVYGVPESFGSVDSICEFWLDLPGVISANSCDEVRKLIRSANPLSATPLLLDEYKNYSMIWYDDCYYAAPHSIGGVDFCNDKERSHPEIISAGSRSELKVKIDKLEKAVPVEYTGWLPQFREFGNCGSHPQFRHIKRPPEGYRFTYSEPAGNGQFAKKTLRQRISLLVSYNPLSTMPLLLVQLFFAAFKLALSARSKGANWRYIFHFFKTRGVKSQLLIPRKRNLLFLPSVPYTLGQHPWVIEIEDSISLLFPFIHNGSTDSECFHRSPYFPILKALFESRSCRVIVTHIKSTAESLPKLFQSDKLTSKIEYVPLGVNTPVTYHKIEEEDDNIRILFNNSWHQDPRSFFIRGGLDVLRAFDRLHKRYSNVSLTLRTSLPNMHPRYADIIERNNIRVINNFMPDKEWEELMISSNIYLLPSDRVHVVSMLEAMSYGLAVVVSDGWGVGDYVQHGHNGMVVKGRYGKITWMDHKTGMLCERYELMQKEDPVVIGNITETLSSLIEDKQLRHRISQQARKDVKDKYNLENWNKGLKRAFDRALGVNAKV